MGNQIIALASELYKDQYKYGALKEPVFNHCKRMAEQAVKYGWDEDIVYGCYLHDVLRLHYHNYYEVYEKIKKIDPVLADLVEQVTQKHTETYRQFIKRNLSSPKGCRIIMLEMFEEVIEQLKDSEQIEIMIEYIPLYIKKIKDI